LGIYELFDNDLQYSGDQLTLRYQHYETTCIAKITTAECTT